MKRVLALATVLSLAVGLSAQTTVPKELAGLQGTWIIETFGDQSLAAQGAHGEITFKGNRYDVNINGTIIERGSVKVDPTKKPAWIDLMIDEGPSGTGGKLQVGLVEVGAGTIKFHLAEPGATTRPTSFDPLPDQAVIIVSKKK